MPRPATAGHASRRAVILEKRNVQKGFFTWSELAVLSSCFRFPPRVLQTTPVAIRLKSKNKDGLPGLSIRALYRVLENGGIAEKTLHKSFDAHSGSTNTDALKTAASLIDQSKLTFQELEEACVAFSMYEHHDNNGIALSGLAESGELSRHKLMKAIKMTNHVASLRRVVQQIGIISGTKKLPRRLRLHEFLKLLATCQTIGKGDAIDDDDHQIDPSTGLFHLSSFEEILLPSYDLQQYKITNAENSVLKQKLQQRGESAAKSVLSSTFVSGGAATTTEAVDKMHKTNVDASGSLWKNLKTSMSDLQAARSCRPTSAMLRPRPNSSHGLQSKESAASDVTTKYFAIKTQKKSSISPRQSAHDLLRQRQNAWMDDSKTQGSPSPIEATYPKVSSARLELFQGLDPALVKVLLKTPKKEPPIITEEKINRSVTHSEELRWKLKCDRFMQKKGKYRDRGLQMLEISQEEENEVEAEDDEDAFQQFFMRRMSMTRQGQRNLHDSRFSMYRTQKADVDVSSVDSMDLSGFEFMHDKVNSDDEPG
eukprot:m.344506 g.344506  ORF g.344506 m.344506 type:complete len:539 (-) comp24553_c0_seq1:3-1619(-)